MYSADGWRIISPAQEYTRFFVYVCGLIRARFNMAITKAKKETTVAKLSKAFKAAQLLAFVNFKGLSVAKASVLRRALRAVGAEYIVAKKTLARVALKEAHVELPVLPDEVAFVFAQDAVAGAKAVYEFGKANPEVRIAGGVYESAVVDADVVVRLAKIPPREVLLAQVVFMLQSPMRGLVGVLNGNQRKLVRVLTNIAGNK